MFYEVVTKITPREGVRYHGRFKKDDGQIIWLTPDRSDKQSIYNSIDLAQKYASTAPIYEVSE